MKKLLLNLFIICALSLVDVPSAMACLGGGDDSPPPPPSVSEISGPSPVCRNDIYTYRVSVNNATRTSYTYTWSVGIGEVRNPATGQFAGRGIPVTITAGTSSSVQVRIIDPTPPDNLASIAATVTGGDIPNSGRNKLVVVNAETTPSAPSSISVNTPPTITNNSFTAAAVSGATSYEWVTEPTTQTRFGRTVSFSFPDIGFYTIKVRAIGCGGTSAYTSTGVFVDFNFDCNPNPFEPIICETFRSGGNINDGLTDANSVIFDVFPNPLSGDEFTVQVPSGVDNAEIIVTDIKGAMIKQMSMNGSSMKVDANDMQDGVYLVRVRAEGFNEVRKLVLSQR